MTVATFPVADLWRGGQQLDVWAEIYLKNPDGSDLIPRLAGRDLSDPADYFGGPKLGRITQWDPYTLSLSDRNGQLQGTSLSFSFLDGASRKLLRKWLGDAVTADSIPDAQLIIRGIFERDRLARTLTPAVCFRGLVKQTAGLANYGAQIQGTDWLTNRLTQPVPLSRIGDAFQGALIADRDRLGPLAYGHLSDEPSATAAPVNANDSANGVNAGATLVGFGVRPGAAPTGVTVTNGGVGSLAAGTYYGMATIVDAGLEGEPAPRYFANSAASPASVTVGTSGAVTVSCDNAGAGKTYRFYLAQTEGSEYIWAIVATSATPSVTFTTTDPSVQANSQYGANVLWDYAWSALMADGETSRGATQHAFVQGLLRPNRTCVTPIAGAIGYYVYRKHVGDADFGWRFLVAPSSLDSNGNVYFEDDQLDNDPTLDTIMGAPTPKGVVPAIYVGNLPDLFGYTGRSSFTFAGHACKGIDTLYLNNPTQTAGAVQASASLGSKTDTTDSKITITVDTAGASGNDQSIAVAKGAGISQPIAVVFVATVLTITLATDGSGNPNAAANTPSAIVAAINGASLGFTAASFDGGTDPLTDAEDAHNFSGGKDPTIDASIRTITKIDPTEYGVTVYAPGKSGWTATYGDVFYDAPNGTRWCVVHLVGPDASNVIAGTSFLTANLDGAETVGDGSGDLIASIVDQTAHLADNFVLTDAPNVGGLWSTAPPTWADGGSRRNLARFAAAKVATAASLRAGDDRAWLITTAVAMGDALAACMITGDLFHGFPKAGDWLVGFESPDLSAPAPKAVLTDTSHLLAGSFSWIDQTDPTWFWKTASYAFAPAWDATGAVTYTQTGTVGPTTGVPDPAGVTNLLGIFSAAQAAEIMSRRQARASKPWRVLPPQTGVNGLDLGIADLVALTAEEGPSEAGWASRLGRIRAESPALGSDLTAFLIEDIDQDEGTDTMIGGEVFDFDGDGNARISVTNYPSGSGGDTLHPGTGIFNIDSLFLIGTYRLEAMISSPSGATITVALVNLTDGSPDTPILTLTSAATIPTRVPSGGTITFAASGAAKSYGIKTKTSGADGFVYGVRIIKVS